MKKFTSYFNLITKMLTNYIGTAFIQKRSSPDTINPVDSAASSLQKTSLLFERALTVSPIANLLSNWNVRFLQTLYNFANSNSSSEALNNFDAAFIQVFNSNAAIALDTLVNILGNALIVWGVIHASVAIYSQNKLDKMNEDVKVAERLQYSLDEINKQLLKISCLMSRNNFTDPQECFNPEETKAERDKVIQQSEEEFEDAGDKDNPNNLFSSQKIIDFISVINPNQL